MALEVTPESDGIDPTARDATTRDNSHWLADPINFGEYVDVIISALRYTESGGASVAGTVNGALC